MEIMGAFAPKRARQTKAETECVREVRAELFTLGGAIVLGVCLLLGAAAFAAFQVPGATGLQRAILLMLTAASWMYFLDSITERLRLVDHSVEFRSLLGRTRLIPLEELEAMLLVYQGFNLDKGIESIEFRRSGKKPERIALGPCWQRHKLEQFLRSVEAALQDPHALEEVR